MERDGKESGYREETKRRRDKYEERERERYIVFNERKGE